MNGGHGVLSPSLRATFRVILQESSRMLSTDSTAYTTAFQHSGSGTNHSMYPDDIRVSSDCSADPPSLLCSAPSLLEVGWSHDGAKHRMNGW
jgi:hypothetical protein